MHLSASFRGNECSVEERLTFALHDQVFDHVAFDALPYTHSMGAFCQSCKEGRESDGQRDDRKVTDLRL